MRDREIFLLTYEPVARLRCSVVSVLPLNWYFGPFTCSSEASLLRCSVILTFFLSSKLKSGRADPAFKLLIYSTGYVRLCFWSLLPVWQKRFSFVFPENNFLTASSMFDKICSCMLRQYCKLVTQFFHFSDNPLNRLPYKYSEFCCPNKFPIINCHRIDYPFLYFVLNF